MVNEAGGVRWREPAGLPRLDWARWCSAGSDVADKGRTIRGGTNLGGTNLGRTNQGRTNRRIGLRQAWTLTPRLPAGPPLRVAASLLRASRFLAAVAVLICTGVFPALAQQVKVLVTVVDEKTGRPIENLQASNFLVVDDKTPLRVVSATYQEHLLDVMVLLDTSALGEVVRPLGASFIDGLGEEEQMAIVAYHDSAELRQDFTNSKELLRNSLRQLRYGNNPRALDGLFAALDSGFDVSSAGRRVIVLLTAGVEGRSQVALGEVLKLAREKRVSIYPVYVSGADRGLFRRLAQRTGGADFGERRLKLKPKELSEVVYSVLRGSYALEISGVYTLGERLEIRIQGLAKSKIKPWASALAME